jgi:translation initiation factor IF-2
MLAGCEIEAMSPEQARRVGELAGQGGHDDVVDVTVGEGAVRRGDVVVVTSNTQRIATVVEAAGGRLRIERVGASL